MTPFSSKPAVVVVEPADHGTNVESSVDGVELEICSRDLGAIGDDGARDDRSQQLGALLEAQALKTAAQSVEENPSCCVELFSREWRLAAAIRLRRGVRTVERVGGQGALRRASRNTYSKVGVDFVVLDVGSNVLDLGVVLS